MSGRRSFSADLHSLSRDFGKMLVETRSLLLPVLLSIGLTQCMWVGIYDCRVTRNIFMFESDSLLDGIRNAGMALLVIVLVSGIMITLAIYNYKKIVKSWLALSSVVCSFVIAAHIFHDGVTQLPDLDANTQLAIVGALTAAYGGGSVLAFFTKHLPAWFHQLYVVTNCAALATFYLSSLPGCTAWFLLAAVAGWDIFAVFAPCGPLKIALERSQDYGADVLRFIMFTSGSNEEEGSQPATAAAAEETPAVDDDDSSDAEESPVLRHPSKRLSAGADLKEEVEQQLRQALQEMVDRSVAEQRQIRKEMLQGTGYSSGSSSDDASGDSDSNSLGSYAEEHEEQQDEGPSSSAPIPTSSKAGGAGGEKNAREALNSGSHLGFGDFIFFSMLVGKSMAVGLFPALVSTCGVIIGLAYTLSIDNEHETLPALPISITIGMFGHFYTVAQMGAMEIVVNYLF